MPSISKTLIEIFFFFSKAGKSILKLISCVATIVSSPHNTPPYTSAEKCFTYARQLRVGNVIFAEGFTHAHSGNAITIVRDPSWRFEPKVSTVRKGRKNEGYCFQSSQNLECFLNPFRHILSGNRASALRTSFL